MVGPSRATLAAWPNGKGKSPARSFFRVRLPAPPCLCHIHSLERQATQDIVLASAAGSTLGLAPGGMLPRGPSGSPC